MAQVNDPLVIDDLADRSRWARTSLLDSGPARRAEDYLQPRRRDGVRLLLGPQYAPVRPEFAALREQALGLAGRRGRWAGCWSRWA